VPDIPREWLNDVKDVLARHIPGVEVRAFGSRVTGRAKRYSDLDLVVMAPSPLDGKTMALLKNAFDESSLPIKVDIVEWAAVSESFQKVIEERYEAI
jgi:type I restriction enzyme S subunit